MIRPNDKPWMNCDVRRAIRKCDRLLKAYCKNRSLLSWDRYRCQHTFTTSLLKFNKSRYYSDLKIKLSDSNIGSKKWWGLIKSIYGQKMMTSIPSLIEGRDVISEYFNEYFASQSTVDDSSAALPDDANFYQTAEILSHITTSEREIRDLFLTLDVGKACGADGIGNRIIKISTDGSARAFSLFSNLSLQRRVFPAQWKAANIIPLFKKDGRQCKSNYRPVSLLNSLSKVLQKVVFIRLYNFLLGIGFLNLLQSGFRPGDSTVNQLLYLVHKMYEALKHGNEVRMIYLDISKAFDRVWHDGLLFKLKSIGIRDPLLAWFKSSRKSYVYTNVGRVALIF